MLKDRWKNRRAMAWIALIAGVLFPVLLIFSQSDQLGSVAGAFYVFISAVVGAYMGFATLDDKWQQPVASTTSVKTNNKDLQEEGFPPEPEQK